MAMNLIVISRSAEIRRSFEESYSLLGYDVKTFEDVVDVIRDLNALDPDHVVMDTDSLPRKWKAVASALSLARKRITIILIASSISFEEANEALVVGVSGIIIKPFFREVHLKRAYDIIQRRQRTGSKRVYPRFYAGSEFRGQLFMGPEEGEGGYAFDVVNISEIGMAVRSKNPKTAPELEPNYVIHDVLLEIGDQQFRIAAVVVYRRGGLIGFQFDRIVEGQAGYSRLIQKLSLKAFGISGIRGNW